MGLDPKANFIGLVTDTGEVSSESGALRIADNVTLRKEGALTLRPTFASLAHGIPTPRAWFPYRGIGLAVSANNVVYNTSTGTILTEYASGTSPPAVRDDIATGVEARGNFYFPSSRGVFKMRDTSASPMYRSGATPTEAVIGYSYATAGASGELLTTGQQVAYRIVTVRTDANGVTVRSRPSGAVIVASTFTGSPFVVIYPSYQLDNPFTKRSIELYRTRVFPTSVQVDDEMQLVKTFDAPTNATIQYTDKVPDTQRGMTLYTSPSRGGIESANDRAPGAACIERYRTCLFFGNIVGPHRITVSYRAGGAVTGSATGVGSRTATANNTAGSYQLTSVSNVTGLQVGMYVVSTTNGTLGRITAIAGTTITVSQPMAVASTGQGVLFLDAFVIDNNATTSIATGTVNKDSSGAPYNTSYHIMQAYFASVGRFTGYEVTPPEPGYDQTVVFERTDRGGTAFTLNATHGGEMSPAIPLVGATGLSSTNDVYPHGLMWSEPDEPEHVPPKNFARVGDSGKAILALIATRDRLLILKEDGVFMLTGDTSANFSIYPLDTTCLCILPGSVKRLQNRVFFLSNLGLVAIDENGTVEVVSRAIQTELAPIIASIRQVAQGTGLYRMTGFTGVSGTADEALGEYWLALGTSTPSFGGQVLAYNLFRGGFTTYSFGTPAPAALSQDAQGSAWLLTSSTYLNPTSTPGAVTARISPHAFGDPHLVGKLWTHIIAGFSQLTGTTSVQAAFTSSEAQVATSLTETFDTPLLGGLVQHPLGSLLRHPVPNAVRRAYLLFVEIIVAVSSGTFTLETIAAEQRENLPNKKPTHGSGAT